VNAVIGKRQGNAAADAARAAGDQCVSGGNRHKVLFPSVENGNTMR
jgi:hypothetical protein